MDKTAQSRGLTNRLHEWGNLVGKSQEKLFNPEFQRVMDSLRSVDGDIRSIVGGKSIDGGDPGTDEVPMKSLIKEARKNFNRREYMTAVSYLGRFHKKANDVINRIDSLNVDVNQIHEDFLFKDIDNEHITHLKNLRNRFSNQVYRESLFVNAGVKDLIHNIFNERGRALAAWEKKYPKQVKKLKKDTENMLNKSEDLLKFILSGLKTMGSYRAGRKPDPYLKEGLKIKGLFDRYHGLFVNYYNENIKGFLDNQKFVDPPSEPDVESKENDQPQSEGPVSEDMPSIPSLNPATPRNTIVSFPPTLPTSKKPDADMTPSEVYDHIQHESPGYPPVAREQKDTVAPPKPPQGMEGLEDLSTQTQTQTQPPPAPADDYLSGFDPFSDELDTQKLETHSKFFNQLKVLSSSSILMAKHIRKYALIISKTDGVMASRLNIIANKIMEK